MPVREGTRRPRAAPRPGRRRGSGTAPGRRGPVLRPSRAVHRTGHAAAAEDHGRLGVRRLRTAQRALREGGRRVRVEKTEPSALLDVSPAELELGLLPRLGLFRTGSTVLPSSAAHAVEEGGPEHQRSEEGEAQREGRAGDRPEQHPSHHGDERGQERRGGTPRRIRGGGSTMGAASMPTIGPYRQRPRVLFRGKARGGRTTRSRPRLGRRTHRPPARRSGSRCRAPRSPARRRASHRRRRRARGVPAGSAGSRSP